MAHAHAREGDPPLRPTSDALAPSTFDTWRATFAAERLRVLYYLGLAANAAFMLADFLLYREFVPALLPYRALIETGFAVVLVSLFRGAAYGRPALPLMAWILIGNLCIVHMTVVLGGFTAPYFNGLNLVFLAAAVIVPISWPSHLIAQAATLVYYYGLNLARPMTPADVNAAIANSFFLVWTSVACLFSVYLYERVQRREFEARQAEAHVRADLEASNEKLRELDRVKSEFFANVSHELRTPLTLSLGAFKTLQRQVADGVTRQVVESGLRNTSRLLFLINELLDLAKLETGRAECRKQPIDLARLVRAVVANFESSEVRRLHLRGLGEPVPIEADPNQIRKVLYNLLSNAFKFNESEQPQVWIRLSTKDDQIEVEVEDNGIGIARDQVHRIFDRFTQVESQTTRRYEGTGIGLALAKEIVVLHGGTITVESEPGRGSVFTLRLPRGAASVGTLVSLEEDEGTVLPVNQDPARDQPASRAFADNDLPQVLVAEDNPDMRAYLSRVLGGRYRVALARDGVEGLDQARALKPELILTDIMMPRMGGYDLLRAVRGDEALRTTPVIFLTARAGMEARIESLDAGADDYIPKPFDEQEVLARVGNLIRSRAQERELVELQKARMRRFLPRPVADAVMSGDADARLAPHRAEITVLFVDLRGYTAFVESAAPEDTMAVLREYQTEMGRLISSFQGTLERFSGDALVVFFNDPLPIPNHPEQAVRMALAMQERVAKLCRIWAARGFDLGAGIGIATGYATLGMIGFEERMDYAAIGAVTNLAARLCGEAQHGQILVSRRFLNLVELVVEAEAVGERTLKGFQRPITAFNVVGLKAG